MKIINKEQFLELPSGTIYAPYDPTIFGKLSIKGESLFAEEVEFSHDFYMLEIVGSVDCTEPYARDYWKRVREMEEEDVSFPVNLEMMSREGECDESQLYAVWEKQDIQSLIAVLQKSLLNFT